MVNGSRGSTISMWICSLPSFWGWRKTAKFFVSDQWCASKGEIFSPARLMISWRLRDHQTAPVRSGSISWPLEQNLWHWFVEWGNPQNHGFPYKKYQKIYPHFRKPHGSVWFKFWSPLWQRKMMISWQPATAGDKCWAPWNVHRGTNIHQHRANLCHPSWRWRCFRVPSIMWASGISCGRWVYPTWDIHQNGKSDGENHDKPWRNHICLSKSLSQLHPGLWTGNWYNWILLGLRRYWVKSY